MILQKFCETPAKYLGVLQKIEVFLFNDYEMKNIKEKKWNDQNLL